MPEDAPDVELPIRERIVVATLRIIAEEGVDAITHRAVAERAGVSPGSTTHHFSSREELLRESFRFYMANGEAFVRGLVDTADDRDVDPFARLERVLERVVEREFGYGLVRAEYELLLFACGEPELGSEVRAWEARLVAVVAGLLEAAGVAKPMAGARMLVNLVRGYELERLLDPGLTLGDFRERLAPLLRALRYRDAPDDRTEDP